MLTYLKNLFLVGLAVLAPIHTVMIITGILIFCDLFTGIMAAKKRGEAITSAAMRRSISKFVIYQTAVITGFLVEVFMIGELIPASKLIAGVIGLVELTSILENVNIIYGKNIFQSVIQRLGSENDKKEE